MSKYGIPYQGSKSRIAEDIINMLPIGDRLVDLFGGGFAISDCVLSLNKYKSVLYNDFNPLIVDLVKRAINGEFNLSRNKPEFITREMFYENKNKDGYIKYIWSFGNNGKDYMFGKNIEPLKHIAHDFVVFDKYNSELDIFLAEEDRVLNETDLKKRRLEFYKNLKKSKHRFDLPQLQKTEILDQLESLERLQQLESLERLQQLERLEITNNDYKEYEYKVGDVVYCDIPYKNTETYNNRAFNHQEFYEWAFTRPYQVFFSSYEIDDKRFSKIWSKTRRSTMSGQNNNVYREECLYCNK